MSSKVFPDNWSSSLQFFAWDNENYEVVGPCIAEVHVEQMELVHFIQQMEEVLLRLKNFQEENHGKHDVLVKS